MVKNTQSNLMASAKMLNIGVINKHTINLEIGERAIQYCLLPISLKFLFISPPPN